MKTIFTRTGITILAALSGFIALFPQNALGGEFVIENKIVNYPYNGNAFIGTVHPDGTMPANWLYPDDYYHGTIYAYYEVLNVPTNVRFGMEVCFFQYYPSRANFDGKNYNENCGDVAWLQGTGSTAKIEGSVPSTWWKMGGRDVDFSRVYDFESMGAVIWGSNPNAPLSPTNGGGDDATYAQQANWLPCSVKVIIVAVSAGSTFSGWDHYINGSGGGGGGGGCTPAQQSTPVYSIDYAGEKTDKVVPSTDEYSYSADMSGALSGSGSKLTLTPGQDVFFRTKKISDCVLASNIQHLSVPARPSAPVITIDYANERTVENIGSTLQYSASSSYTNPVTGAGNKVTLTPGQDLYFWVNASGSSFYSPVTHLTVPARPSLSYTGAGTINTALFTVQAVLAGSMTGFDLSHVSVTNGVAQNLRSGTTFDVVPTATGNVNVVIPANVFGGASFASNTVVVNYSPGGGSQTQQPTPTYGIDYGAEKTDKPVPSTDEYSNNANMSGVLSGSGSKLTLTPGQDLYFRTKAGGNLLASEIQHLIIPGRPSLSYMGAGTITAALFTVQAVLAGSMTGFDLSHVAVTNGVAQNLRSGTTFDVVPTAAGNVNVIIPANVFGGASFASNTVVVNYSPGGGSQTQQPIPTYGINFSAEKTDKSVPSTDEYSTNADMSGAVSGSGSKLTLVPGKDIYFRTKAGNGLLVSDIQHLVVPSRPLDPIVTVDFINETSVENIPANVGYSASATYLPQFSGSGSKIPLIPGQDIYLWVNASASSFYSGISHFKIPDRPAAPSITIDYVNETTSSVSSSMVWSPNASMTPATSGTDAPLTATPGTDLYFRLIPTGSSFASEVQNLHVPLKPVLQYAGNDTITISPFTVQAVLDAGFTDFDLTQVQVTNGMAQNLRAGNVFDVVPASKGEVHVVIPYNAINGTGFASNEVVVYFNTVVTGIPQTNGDYLIIYPNPSRDGWINIRTHSEIAYTVDFYTIEGSYIRSVKINKSENPQINVTDLPKGAYLLKIHTANGVKIEKVILE